MSQSFWILSGADPGGGGLQGAPLLIRNGQNLIFNSYKILIRSCDCLRKGTVLNTQMFILGEDAPS